MNIKVKKIPNIIKKKKETTEFMLQDIKVLINNMHGFLIINKLPRLKMVDQKK